jgi:hypothetical protein
MSRTGVGSVCSNDYILFHKTTEVVFNRVRLVEVITTETDKITLHNTFDAREIVETNMKNRCNISLMILRDVIVRIIDLDFLLVEYTFGSNKKPTRERTSTPHDCRSTIILYRQFAVAFPQESQDILCTIPTIVQDSIFGMFQVSVLHMAIIHEKTPM